MKNEIKIVLQLEGLTTVYTLANNRVRQWSTSNLPWKVKNSKLALLKLPKGKKDEDQSRNHQNKMEKR